MIQNALYQVQLIRQQAQATNPLGEEKNSFDNIITALKSGSYENPENAVIDARKVMNSSRFVY